MNLPKGFFINQVNDFFLLTTEGQIKIGHLHFYLDEKNRYVVDSTVVDPSYRGQGLANHLMANMIALARKEKRYIYPTCSFAVRILQHEQFRDLWDPLEGEPSGGSCTWMKP